MTPAERAFLARSRTATLATLAPDGRPRLVPICFVLDEHGARLYTPLDEKPKATGEPRRLARVRDIQRRRDVTVLVDRWDEDWDRLAWLRCDGRAQLVEPPGDEHRTAVGALRAKYGQYRSHDLEHRPVIRVDVERVRSWGAVSDRGTAASQTAEDSGSSSSPGDSPRH
jgi:PPOX class probable F420-dependent enzyme